nr:hypothetical protein [Tanacetum cinerariifolium]
VYTLNPVHRYDAVIDALIISTFDAFFTWSVCLKSQPNIMLLPPKNVCGLSNMSLRQRSRASKQRRSFIGASSQMRRSGSLSKSASWLFFFMLQVNSSCKLSGILNREWAVLPGGNNEACKAASSKAVTHSWSPPIRPKASHAALFVGNSTSFTVRISRKDLQPFWWQSSIR